MAGTPIATQHVPATTDRAQRLRLLEHRVRLLAAAVRLLADAAASGETELAQQARELSDLCED
jgi:hypothetical protein